VRERFLDPTPPPLSGVVRLLPSPTVATADEALRLLSPPTSLLAEVGVLELIATADRGGVVDGQYSNTATTDFTFGSLVGLEEEPWWSEVSFIDFSV
jgi:hypothetical protein